MRWEPAGPASLHTLGGQPLPVQETEQRAGQNVVIPCNGHSFVIELPLIDGVVVGADLDGFNAFFD